MRYSITRDRVTSDNNGCVFDLVYYEGPSFTAGLPRFQLLTSCDVQRRLRLHEEAVLAEVGHERRQVSANIVPTVQQSRYEGEITLCGRINISTRGIVNM